APKGGGNGRVAGNKRGTLAGGLALDLPYLPWCRDNELAPRSGVSEACPSKKALRIREELVMAITNANRRPPTRPAVLRGCTPPAGALGMPAVWGMARGAHAADGKVVKVVPEADLKILDPIWTTATITGTHGWAIYDTLFAMDAKLKPQPQMVEKYELDDD